jgi:hypothetical protein
MQESGSSDSCWLNPDDTGLAGRSLPAKCQTFFEYNEIDSGPALLR